MLYSLDVFRFRSLYLVYFVRLLNHLINKDSPIADIT